MRVIAGKWKNTTLEQPRLTITRPTTDRIKEAIFSMIQFEIQGKVILDLFSGSGSLAIEALSRGAIKAIAIEQNPHAIKIIQENKLKLKIHNLILIKSDTISYLANLKGTKFDYIFLDPPYDSKLYEPILKIITQQKMLKKYGFIILETNNPHKITLPNGLTLNKIKKYGSTSIMLIANNI